MFKLADCLNGSDGGRVDSKEVLRLVRMAMQ